MWLEMVFSWLPRVVRMLLVMGYLKLENATLMALTLEVVPVDALDKGHGEYVQPQCTVCLREGMHLLVWCICMWTWDNGLQRSIHGRLLRCPLRTRNAVHETMGVRLDGWL